MKRFPARSPTAHVQSGFLSASWGELISSGPGTHRHLFNPGRDQAFLASASGRSAALFFVLVRTKTIVVAVGSQCAAIGGDILDYAGCRASTGSPRTEAPALPALGLPPFWGRLGRPSRPWYGCLTTYVHDLGAKPGGKALPLFFDASGEFYQLCYPIAPLMAARSLADAISAPELPAPGLVFGSLYHGA